MNEQHHVAAHQIAVRQATIFDLDLLVPMFDAYRQFYRKPGDLDLARRFLLERFQHNESIIFLAMQQDGSAAGFTQLFPSLTFALRGHFPRPPGFKPIACNTEFLKTAR